MYTEWAAGRISSAEVLRLHGHSVLRLLEGQWAFMADDTLQAADRLQALHASTPLDSQEFVDTIGVGSGMPGPHPVLVAPTWPGPLR